MSSTQLTTTQSSTAENRRSGLRRKLGSVAFIECGPDNGGILLDLSEGGVGFQGVGILRDGQFLQLRFVLPGATQAIETSGQLVWSNEAKKGGGLRFVKLENGAREEIGRWLAGSNSAVSPEAAKRTVSAVSLPGEIRETLPQDVSGTSVTTGETAVRQDGKPSIARTPLSDELPLFRGAEPAPRNSRLAPPRKEAPSELAPKLRVVLSGIPEQSSRMASYLWGAVCVCSVILAATIGVVLHGGISGVLAGKLTFPSGQLAPGGVEDFQVEVVDANNRRWVLSDGDQTHSSDRPAPEQNTATLRASLQSLTVATPPASSAPIAVPPARIAAFTASAAPLNKSLSQLALHAPHVRRSLQPVPDGRQEPAIADSLPPLAVFVDPHLIAAGPANPSRPAQLPAELVRQSGVQNAVLIKRVEPIYPPTALQIRLEGTVEVKAAIDRDGVPHELRLVSGDPRLAKSAMDAIRQWRYKPTILDGEPAEGEVIVDLEFRLRKN